MSELTQDTIEEHGEVVVDTGHNVVASLGLDVQLFVFQLLNFFIVVLIVWFLILKPLTKKMEERRKIIDESLDNAKEVETNLMMSKQKFKEKIEEAEILVNTILEKTSKDAEQLSSNMKNSAKEEIKVLIEQAKEKLKKEHESSMEELKEEATEMITVVLEKVLNEKLDSKKDTELINTSIKEYKTYL